MQEKSVVVFDGQCAFCRLWIDYWRRMTGNQVEYLAYQEIADRFPGIPAERFREAVHVVLPDGEVLSGARAVFQLLTHAPGGPLWLWLYDRIPGFAPTTELGYRIVARHRNFSYRVTRLMFGTRIVPSTYATAEWLFLRALAVIYLIAFVSFGIQATGLIGSHGILPAIRYLQAVSRGLGVSGYWTVPTIFWLNSSDAFLKIVCGAGAAVSIVLLLGFLERAALVCLFALYLSLCTASQDFMSFQWDMLLLEAGFLAIFLGRSRVIVWLFRWLLFRLMFLSGAVKLLSHDPAWRGLTAMSFHYETQPLPTPVAWYAHQLPFWFQRASTAMVFVIELLVPFLLLGPRRIRFFGVRWILFLQILIFITGNYTFFNLLAIALCVFVFDDAAFPKLTITARKAVTPNRVAIAVATLILALGLALFCATFFDFVPPPGDALLRLASPFGIVNSYGLFAVMTTRRPEIIVQGSNDGVNWLDYEFKYKPGDLHAPPRWVAPYQPRLDWQMWFAALAPNYRGAPWFVSYMVRLLQASPDVLGLMAKNPFPDAPPKYVRAELFDYKFTDFQTRKHTGQWWRRDPAGLYLPSISLEDVRQAGNAQSGNLPVLHRHTRR